jgi:hypothetical protein
MVIVIVVNGATVAPRRSLMSCFSTKNGRVGSKGRRAQHCEAFISQVSTYLLVLEVLTDNRV